MNFWSWLENLFRAFRPSRPPVAVPVVPPPVVAPVSIVPPVVAPVPVVLPIVVAPPPVPVIVPKPVIPPPAPVVVPPVPITPPFVASPKPSFEPVFGRGSFGLSHVHNPAHSVSDGVLNSVARVQANHLMGFATGNPQPVRNGPFEWGDIDRFMNRMRGATTPILVANSAPGWMMPSGKDYDMDSRLKREHFGDYAKLVQAAMLRYTWIKTLVVWNEMKGFGKTINGQWRWDYEEYTELYNMVWDAVKAVRPDVRIGGPYMVLDTYSSANQSNPSSTWRGAWGVGDQRVLDSYNYWRKNARGFDWVAFDFGPNHRDRGSLFSDARCLDKMLDFMKWCRTWTDKPLVCMETYPHVDGSSDQADREMWVSILKRMRSEISGESAALAWDEKNPHYKPWLDADLVAVLSRFQVLES